MKTQEQIIAELKKATAWMAGLIVVLALMTMALFAICYQQNKLIDKLQNKYALVYMPSKQVISEYADTIWLRDTTYYDTIKYKIR